MYTRPSSMAAAFINAAVKAEHIGQALSNPTVDHWVPRRVAMNTDRPGFAIVIERDKKPSVVKPRKEFTTAEKAGIVAGITDLMETSHYERMLPVAHLEDGEGSID